jgi:hypothetical protein
MGFNKAAVSVFKLCEQIDKNKFGQTKIYNFVDTGLTSVAKPHKK